MNLIINMDKESISISRVKELFSTTYWAKDRDVDIIEKSFEHSECIAVYHDDFMVGFARIVTDYTTMFWLCDVVIDEKYRGNGIGNKMITFLKEQEFYKPLMGVLATRNAHGLYEKFGFYTEKVKFMRKDKGV